MIECLSYQIPDFQLKNAEGRWWYASRNAMFFRDFKATPSEDCKIVH